MKYLALKILLIDLPISLFDTGSDFYQAYNMWSAKGLENEAIIMFFVNWLPGLVAAIHIISVKRQKYGPKKTLVWAGNVFCFQK